MRQLDNRKLIMLRVKAPPIWFVVPPVWLTTITKVER